MPEHIRALVVILVLATACFLLARKSATEYAIAEEDFSRRRNLWYAVTLVAFLAHNFWIFLLVTAAVLAIAARREWNPIALFLWLFLALPSFGASVSGFGIVNQLLVIDYQRLLALVILLPAALRLRGRTEGGGPLVRVADWTVIGYSLLQLVLRYNVDTATNTARYGVYAVLDVWLPYFVASRSLRDVRAFRDALMSFVIASMIVATIAMFEYLRHWLLYRSLLDALGASGGVGEYLSRGGSLRASATAGHAIPLGYVMAVALGAHLYIRYVTSRTLMWWLGFFALSGGLVASLSRGPWLGAVFVSVAFIVCSPRAAATLTKVVIVSSVLGALVLISPMGASVIDHLPFIGTIEAGNITYRQRLLEVGLLVIKQNPLFGSFDYLYRPEMQELVLGGMIDIVNSYLGVALSSGLVGLTLFTSAFVAGVAAVFSARRLVPDPEDETRLLGNALFATHGGLMVMFFTMSSITVVPLVYWTFIGLGIGYSIMVRQQAGGVIDAGASDVDPIGSDVLRARVRAS